MGGKACLCLMILAVAGAGAGAGETSDKAGSGLSKPEIHEREDLSVEETGSDYARQFGGVQAFPQFGHPQRYPSYHGHPWVPYQQINYPEYSQPPIDPYVLRVLERYLRHLPHRFGIYEGTKIRPAGVFRFVDKETR